MTAAPRVRAAGPATRQSSSWLSIALVLCFAMSAAFYFWTADARLPAVSAAPSSYYGMLTDAFLHGRIALFEKPVPKLLALADPYDPVQNQPFALHDALLYRGQYYLYWGVAPVLLLYGPVRLLTGGFMHDTFACAIFSTAGLLFYLLLIRLIRADYFPTSSLWTTVLIALLCALGSLAPFVLRRPQVYEVAILCAYFLVAAFLYFGYRSFFRRELEFRSLVTAAVVLGFVFLSRPNLAVCALVLATGSYRYANRGETTRLGLFSLFGVAFGPLAICIGLQALYNFARFDSPLEYGMRYQLAGIEVSKYHIISISRALYTGLLYLFSVPSFLPTFPFVVAQPDALPWPLSIIGQALRPFLSFTLFEPAIGIVVAVPAVVALLAYPSLLMHREGSGARSFLSSLLIIALFTGFATSCFGATLRYEVDFLPSLLLATGIVVFWFETVVKARWQSVLLRSTLSLSVLYSGLISVALSMSGYSNYYLRFYPSQYEALARSFRPVQDWFGSLNGYPGIVRASADQTICAPPELGQPLLTTGVPGAGDFISVRCDAASDEFMVAWDHWGVPAKLGKRFALHGHGPIKVEVVTPALFAPWTASAGDPDRSSCDVRIDGQEVFHQRQCVMYPNRSSEIYQFKNPIGGTTVAAAYAGNVRGPASLGEGVFFRSSLVFWLLAASAAIFAVALRRTRDPISVLIYAASVIVAFVAGAALGNAYGASPAEKATLPIAGAAPKAPQPLTYRDERMWKDELSGVQVTRTAKSRARINGSMVIQNASPVKWSAVTNVVGGYRWIDASGRNVSEGRFKLPPTFDPGEKQSVSFSFQAPQNEGRYRLELDLLREHIGWFQPYGNAPALIDIEVLK